ncbi:MAG TPA: hypothetical protein VNL18_15675, partial [Gemmatimonadales bacterium]|nr:hypothetical protein [Gemmatimonadales bacterium]
GVGGGDGGGAGVGGGIAPPWAQLNVTATMALTMNPEFAARRWIDKERLDGAHDRTPFSRHFQHRVCRCRRPHTRWLIRRPQAQRRPGRGCRNNWCLMAETERPNIWAMTRRETPRRRC